MAEIVPIGPGAESVDILVYAADADGARWDRSSWDGGVWAAVGWQSVDCEIGEAAYRWGASSEAGILSIAEAGEIDLATIDPLRRLDPINSASPFYGYVKPGTPVRIVGNVGGGLGAVANGSFESGLTGWTVSSPTLCTVSAIADAPDGGSTLRIESDGIAASPNVWQMINVSPGMRLTISATVRVSAGATGTLRIDGYNATAEVAHGMLLRNGTAQVFAPIGGTFEVPEGVTRLRLWLYLPGTQATALAARFDAVTLTSEPLAAATGFIDEAAYDLASGRGRIRAIDGIAYLSQAQLPDGATLPNTLRARVREVVRLVGYTTLVPVEPEAATDPDVDPPVTPHDGKAAPAWAVISKASLDALVYVWVDPTGTLRFRSWGSLPDAPLSIGCPPDDADPADVWLEGISTIDTTASADAVRNSVRAYTAGTTWSAPVQDPISIARYGPRPFDIDRVVPDRAVWSQRILDDRADAGLEVAVGTVRPYTPAELSAMLALGLDGPAIVRIRDDAHGEPVDLEVGMIGAQVGITPAGWRFALATMISRVDWENIEPPPPIIPPIPPPDPWHVETRTYLASSDALLALSPGGAKYGAGAATTLPVGGWQGWTYRSCVKFASIPWSKVRAVRSASLHLRTTTQVRVGFGSSPKVELRRITAAWSAGSASSPSSGNAVVWPGPPTTSSGAVTSSMPGGQNVDKSISCTAIVRAWAPASAGGSGAQQYGIELRETGNVDNTTSEVWPVEQGGAARPELTLTLEVFD